LVFANGIFKVACSLNFKFGWIKNVAFLIYKS
jgi:hypothetical protein